MPRHWRWLIPYLFLLPGGLWLLAFFVVPMLFVQGTRDPFGTPLQLEPILSTLDTPARVHRVMTALVLEGDALARVGEVDAGDRAPSDDDVFDPEDLGELPERGVGGPFPDLDVPVPRLP